MANIDNYISSVKQQSLLPARPRLTGSSLKRIYTKYGHLVEHLIDVDDTTKKNDMWTGVFTRDDDPLKAVPLYFIGEAIKYDRSLRDILPDWSN